MNLAFEHALLQLLLLHRELVLGGRVVEHADEVGGEDALCGAQRSGVPPREQVLALDLDEVALKEREQRGVRGLVRAERLRPHRVAQQHRVVVGEQPVDLRSVGLGVESDREGQQAFF